jgi:hypothetical protein
MVRRATPDSALGTLATLLLCGGTLLLLAGFLLLPEDVAAMEDVARSSVPVRAEVLSTRISVSKGRHYAQGTFRFEGQKTEGPIVLSLERNVSFGRPRRDEESARRLVAHFPVGALVEAWHDTRSRDDGRHLPLRLVDPARLVEKERRVRDGARILGGSALLLGVALFAVSARARRRA